MISNEESQREGDRDLGKQKDLFPRMLQETVKLPVWERAADGSRMRNGGWLSSRHI